MQSVGPTPFVATNTEDHQHAFWSEVMRIALQGEEHPASLTEDEIRRMCRLALIVVHKQDVLDQSGVTAHSHLPSEAPASRFSMPADALADT